MPERRQAARVPGVAHPDLGTNTPPPNAGTVPTRDASRRTPSDFPQKEEAITDASRLSNPSDECREGFGASSSNDAQALGRPRADGRPGISLAGAR